MRVAGWLRLAALCLIAVNVPASGSLAAAQPSSTENPLKPSLQEEFTGYGKTVKEAENDAIAQSCQWMEKHPDLGCSPGAQYLRVHNMIRPEGEPSDKVFESAGSMKVVKMKLTVSSEQAREIRKQAQVQAQQQRMKSHQWLSLLALIGVVCLLGVVGGYLRLEEATKGYYTRLLRVAAIGAFILIVLGLCVMA